MSEIKWYEDTKKPAYSKLIIYNATDLPDETAVELVHRVVKQGKISNNHTQYCYHTEFSGYHVSVNKVQGSDTHTFRVSQE